MTFSSGREMLDGLTDLYDLYSRDKEIYVFGYNDSGSIAYYYIDNDEMDKLLAEANKYETCVSGLLGPGGHIVDDPSYEYFREGDYSNLDWCNANYDGEWEEVPWG